MDKKLSRRDFLSALGAAGVSAGFLTHLAGAETTDATLILKKRQIYNTPMNRRAASLVNGKIIQPQWELPVLLETDVLVVGGGSAGTAAAIAAARNGADVTLVERYNHFGGLYTGSMVIWICGLRDDSGSVPRQVVFGLCEEMMQRLDKMKGGIIRRHKIKDKKIPTADVESAKHVLLSMVDEAGVKIIMNCWGVDAIMDGNTVRGAVFESKSGRQGILAKVVIDASGDGDIYAASGAGYEHVGSSISGLYRLGNMDSVPKESIEKLGKVIELAKEKGEKHVQIGSRTPLKGIHVTHASSGSLDAINVLDLSKLEVEFHKDCWQNLEKLHKIPGYEEVYIVDTAPQLGVRLSRLLDGVEKLTYKGYKKNKKFDSVIGVGGLDRAWQIPYGALVPKKIDNILAAGRCISCDRKLADYMRLIPACFVSGQAAGVAAAFAVKDKCLVRDVDIPKLQKELRKEKVNLDLA